MNLAKQSTAKTFLVGPILDADGVAKTDEVVASIKVTKNGTVGAVDAQDTLTHNHTGHYVFVSDGGDFDTLGEVEFTLNSGTNAMAPVKFQVVPADLYDTLMVAQPAAGIKKFFNIETPVLTVASVNQTIDNPTAAAIGTDAASKVLVTPAQKLATDANGKVAVPDTQKVDVETIKTRAVTCAAGVTVLASVGTAAASTAQTGDAYNIVKSGGAGDAAAILADTTLIIADTGLLEKQVLNKTVLDTVAGTIILYDDNSTTPLKTWAVTETATVQTRNKAT